MVTLIFLYSLDEWTKEFQKTYLIKGMHDLEAQAPYLEELAQYYEMLFEEENSWEHAYKVCLTKLLSNWFMYRVYHHMMRLNPLGLPLAYFTKTSK